jgi:hypothetical protein
VLVLVSGEKVSTDDAYDDAEDAPKVLVLVVREEAVSSDDPYEGTLIVLVLVVTVVVVLRVREELYNDDA